LFACALILPPPPNPPLQGEAVRQIEEGRAPRIQQWEGGATYDKIWNKKELAEVRKYFFLDEH